MIYAIIIWNTYNKYKKLGDFPPINPKVLEQLKLFKLNQEEDTGKARSSVVCFYLWINRKRYVKCSEFSRLLKFINIHYHYTDIALNLYSEYDKGTIEYSKVMKTIRLEHSPYILLYNFLKLTGYKKLRIYKEYIRYFYGR